MNDLIPNASFHGWSFPQGANADHIQHPGARHADNPGSVGRIWPASFAALGDAPTDAQRWHVSLSTKADGK